MVFCQHYYEFSRYLNQDLQPNQHHRNLHPCGRPDPSQPWPSSWPSCPPTSTRPWARYFSKAPAWNRGSLLSGDRLCFLSRFAISPQHSPVNSPSKYLSDPCPPFRSPETPQVQPGGLRRRGRPGAGIPGSAGSGEVGSRGWAGGHGVFVAVFGIFGLKF